MWTITGSQFTCPLSVGFYRGVNEWELTAQGANCALSADQCGDFILQTRMITKSTDTYNDLTFWYSASYEPMYEINRTGFEKACALIGSWNWVNWKSYLKYLECANDACCCNTVNVFNASVGVATASIIPKEPTERGRVNCKPVIIYL